LSNTNCVLYWKREDDKFVAINKGGTCKTYSSYFKKNIVVKDLITLLENQIWILDSIYDKNGKLIMGRNDSIANKLKKCSFYKGWAAIKKDAVSDTSKSKYIGFRGLVIHNQGQHTSLVDESGLDAGYEISLSQLTYAGSNTPVLKLGLHEKGEKKTVSYIWGEPKAKRLGLNIKWIQTGFTLIEGQRFSK